MIKIFGYCHKSETLCKDHFKKKLNKLDCHLNYTFLKPKYLKRYFYRRLKTVQLFCHLIQNALFNINYVFFNNFAAKTM